MKRPPSLSLTFASLVLGAALGAATLAVVPSTFAMALPTMPNMPKVDAKTWLTAPITVAGKTVLMTKVQVAQLAGVPEAKLEQAMELSPDKAKVSGAALSFECPRWIRPTLNTTVAHALFTNVDCSEQGTIVWFNALANKGYMVECAGSLEDWRLLVYRPSSSANEEKRFTTATESPWVSVQTTTAGWYGVHFQDTTRTETNDSYTVSRCRVWPVAP